MPRPGASENDPFESGVRSLIEISLSPADTPDVSVIMPVYNRAWCVAEAVESVMAITNHRVELLTIDDGSTDATPAVLAELHARYADRMRVLRHPGGANLGIAASRNLGLAEARAPYVAFLDSDDLFLPNRFDLALPWMRSHPQLFAGLEPYELEEHGKVHLIKHLTELSLDSNGGVDALGAMLQKSMHWTVPVVTVNRRAFSDFGGFDPKFKVGEDTALWMRFAAARVVGVVGPDAAVARVRRHQAHSWTEVDAERAQIVFFNVLCDALSWARRNRARVNRNDVNRLRKRLRSYLLETVSSPAIRAGKAIAIWTRAVRILPRLLLDRALLVRLAHLLRPRQLI